MIGTVRRSPVYVRVKQGVAALPLLALALVVVAGCHRHGVGNDNNNDAGTVPCGEGYVLVPAGPFEMGVDRDDPRFFLGAPMGSYPRHVVQMSDYCIGRTEVSVASYRACVDAGVCDEPAQVTDVLPACNFSREPGDREEHPVTCVTWDQARTYCRDWEGGDLPTEAQWEKAARGDSMDGRLLPWGDEPVSCDRANYDENGLYNEDTGHGLGYGCFHTEYPATWPVGYLARADSPYGAEDMAGNVSEHTLDCYDRTFYAQCAEEECTDPVCTEVEGCRRSARGAAAWADEYGFNFFAVIGRGGYETSAVESRVGFRCAEAAPMP